MRCIVQRVSRASVTVGNTATGEIGRGLLVLAGFRHGDSDKEIEWMCNKLAHLRIFEDEYEKMNLSVTEIGGAILLVSQFTLYGDAQKGFRPSFVEAARPQEARPLYERMTVLLREKFSLPVATGIFGAMMEVSLVNSGPVTIFIEK